MRECSAAAVLRAFGFSEPQSGFLVLVLEHSGVCPPRQYRTFSEIAHGRQTPIAVPPKDSDFVRETPEALHMSRQVFAFRIGVNPRTLERWEQGRSKPNE
jgi:hypothetical protein